VRFQYLKSSLPREGGFVTNESTEFYQDCVAAGALGAGLGALAHLGLWPIVKHLDPADPLAPLFSYGMGVSLIAIPFVPLMLKWRMGRAVAGLLFCIGGVGGSVTSLRLYRKWVDLDRRLTRSSGHVAGIIQGARDYGQAHRRADSRDWRS
jgi:hypothetical protein